MLSAGNLRLGGRRIWGLCSLPEPRTSAPACRRPAGPTATPSPSSGIAPAAVAKYHRSRAATHAAATSSAGSSRS